MGFGALLALVVATTSEASAWQRLRTETDGLILEQRELTGAPGRELRVLAHSPRSPEALVAAVWSPRRHGVEYRYVEHYEVLSETDDERLIYVRLRPPFVARRDYALRYWRNFEPATGEFRVVFRTEPGEGPPPHGDIVRIASIRGEWVFAPDGTGGTHILHRCVSDPGADVPGWLVAGQQEDVAVTLVREVIAFAIASSP